ncbi:hypothetical protein ACJRO7_020273 [Eucalyptus globulus]|uniref:Uncharacterized protein n=1 Tax=Eucalyptus globulus TaxID=34317 RepID=A0ABD3KSR6_EUCGL
MTTDEPGGYRRDDREQPTGVRPPSLSLPSLFPTGEPPRRPSGSGSGPDSSVPYSFSLLASLSALPLFYSEPPRDRRTTAPPFRLQIRHRLVQWKFVLLTAEEHSQVGLETPCSYGFGCG